MGCCGVPLILRQLVEIRVDTEKFDLTQWTQEAEFAGWDNLPENGLWYLVEDIAATHETRGLRMEIIPGDPFVSES